MFIKFETLVKGEQYRDMRRVAQRERLVRQACAGRQATQPGVRVLGLVRRLAGWTWPDRCPAQPIYRSEETTAL